MVYGAEWVSFEGANLLPRSALRPYIQHRFIMKAHHFSLLSWFNFLKPFRNIQAIYSSRDQSHLSPPNIALFCFPDISKRVELKDGTCYAYSYVRAVALKPTFLLLHGFPSANYEWRHQIKFLSSRGFGVLAPDLLGYGDTDSPS